MKALRTLPLTAFVLIASGSLYAQSGDLPSMGETRAPGMGTPSQAAPTGDPGLQPRESGQGLMPRQPSYDTAPDAGPGLRPGQDGRGGDPSLMRDTPPGQMAPGTTPPTGMQPGQMGPGGTAPETPPAGGMPPGQGFGRQ